MVAYSFPAHGRRSPFRESALLILTPRSQCIALGHTHVLRFLTSWIPNKNRGISAIDFIRYTTEHREGVGTLRLFPSTNFNGVLKTSSISKAGFPICVGPESGRVISACSTRQMHCMSWGTILLSNVIEEGAIWNKPSDFSLNSCLSLRVRRQPMMEDFKGEPYPASSMPTSTFDTNLYHGTDKHAIEGSIFINVILESTLERDRYPESVAQRAG